MNRTIAYCALIAFAAVSIAISVSKPAWLSDQNSFLKEFVNFNLLNVLGVILAITLASTANIHLSFNQIEEKYQKPGGLSKSRENLRKAAYWLIGLFVIGVLLVVVKPISCQTDISEALFNSGALLILLWQVLILISLTQLVFSIEPNFERTSKESH